jgi:hypothetical protein
MSTDTDLISAVIAEGYFNGAFNGLDTAAMKRAFHRDFAIFSADGDALARYPIGTWIGAIEQRKAAAGFDVSSARRSCRIVQLDVTGAAAAAKIEIDRDGLRLYTDYLSLLRFADGWKIVAKVYVDHSSH